MVTSEAQIEHPGLVETVSGQTVFVRVEPQSACGNCRVASQCNLAEMQDKVIEVHTNGEGGYVPGQSVVVLLDRSLGFKALFLGYLIPFLLLIATIASMMIMFGDELISSLVGLSILVPYYLWLYWSRKRLAAKFRFRIRRR